MSKNRAWKLQKPKRKKTKEYRLSYEEAQKKPDGFRSLTGLSVVEFEELLREVEADYEAAEEKRLARPDRQRQRGAGNSFQLSRADRLLLTLTWVRIYVTSEVLGLFFGLHKSNIYRNLQILLPLVQQQTELALPDGEGAVEEAEEGDKGYQGLGEEASQRAVTVPHKKPKGGELTEEQKLFNRVFNRGRVVVEHALAHLKVFQVLKQVYRHQRAKYNTIFRMIAGLVNRRLDRRLATAAAAA